MINYNQLFYNQLSVFLATELIVDHAKKLGISAEVVDKKCKHYYAFLIDEITKDSEVPGVTRALEVCIDEVLSIVRETLPGCTNLDVNVQVSKRVDLVGASQVYIEYMPSA